MTETSFRTKSGKEITWFGEPTDDIAAEMRAAPKLFVTASIEDFAERQAKERARVEKERVTSERRAKRMGIVNEWKARKAEDDALAQYDWMDDIREHDPVAMMNARIIGSIVLALMLTVPFVSWVALNWPRLAEWWEMGAR